MYPKLRTGRIAITATACATAMSAVLLAPNAFAGALDSGPAVHRATDWSHTNRLDAASREATKVYIVKLRGVEADKDKVTAAANDLIKQDGGTLRRVYYSAVQGFSVDLTDAQYTKYLSASNINSIGLDQTFVTAGVQQNPPSWGLDRIDQHDLPLDKSYTYPNDAANVHVYVVDTGVRTSHKDFGGRAHGAYDAVDSNDQSATDCNGHGTEVAAAIAGSGYGVAKGADIESVRAIKCDGTSDTETMMSAVDWINANAKKPAIVNLSWSGDASSVLDLQLYSMTQQGIAYTAAAGNGNKNDKKGMDACDVTPSRQTTAITVGATDESDARPGWSNYGACVHLFAPGNNIVTAGNADDEGSATVSGTSMSAAEVSGAAAIYLNDHPDTKPVDLDKALLDSATKDKVQNPGDQSKNLLLYTGK